MKKFATILILFFGLTRYSFAFTTLTISGLPSTLQVGDTVIVAVSGGTTPYSWNSYNPGSITCTQLDSNSAQLIAISPANGVNIQVTDSVSNMGNQFVDVFNFRTRFGNAAFIDGDTVLVPIYYSNKVNSVDLFSAEFDLPYDTTVFKYIGYNKNGTLSSSMLIASNYDSIPPKPFVDTIKIAMANTNPTGITDEQIFLMLRFVSKNTVLTSQTRPLHFTKFVVDETLSGAFLDGNVTVDPVPNYPPVFGQTPSDTTINEGDIYTTTLLATDANGDSVHYFLTMNPAAGEASIDSSTGEFIFSPTFTSEGAYLFEVTANDGNGLTVQHQFTITVSNVNLSPAFSPMFPDTMFAQEGLPFSFSMSASDPDSNTVRYSLIGAPAGMTIDSVTGQLNYTASFFDAGNQLAVFEAHDQFGGTVSHPQIFIVLDSNRAPIFSIVPNDTLIVETQSYNGSICATDPDGDSVKYFVQSGTPPLFLLDSMSGAISWTPDNALAGVYPITIVVTDNKAYGTATHLFTISVDNVNLTPVITTTFPDTVYLLENQNYSFDMDATDGDNDTLSYYAVSLLPGMTMDSVTGLIEWTPSLTQAGLYSTTFKAKDSSGAFGYQYVVFKVFNLNQFPVFTSVLNDTTINENQFLSFTYTADDFDLDTLSFASFPPILGLYVSPEGTLEWQPSFTQAGIETVIVMVSDGYGGFAFDTTVITINNVNNPPLFTTTMPDTAIARFDTLRFHYTGFDSDSQTVAFSFLMSPPGATITPTGDLEWSPSIGSNGLYTFIVKLSDDSSVFVTDTVLVKVFRFGDVSGNGTVTSFDAGMILRHEVSAITLDTVQKRVGNVSGDSTISSTDASLILQYVVGLINNFPGGLGKQTQNNAVLSAFSFRIVPSQISGDYDLFVSVNKPSHVVGITMSLGFDSSLVVPKSMKQTELTDSMSMAFFFPKGKANMALAGIKPLNTEGIIAKFTFTLKNPNYSSDAVLFTMDKFVLNEKDFAKEIGGIALSVNSTASIPTTYDLKQNFPNPFNPATTINYQLPSNSKVTISVYNLLGQLVTTLVNKEESAGYHSIQWDGTDSFNRTVSSGVYLYKIVAQSQGKNLFVETKKMLLLK